MLRKDLKLDDNLNDQSKKINIPSESYEKYFYEKLPNKFRLKNIILVEYFPFLKALNVSTSDVNVILEITDLVSTPSALAIFS